MLRDLKYGLRRLAHQKVFSISVVLLLVLGIGSNTVIFSFVDSLLWKFLPVRNPQNLYLIQQQRKRQVRPETTFFYQQFETVRAQKRIFSDAIAEQGWAGNSFQALSLGDGVHLVSTQIVSPNYFADLDVRAIRGRVLDQTDAGASSHLPVVISEQCWSTQFHRDPDIVNRVIRIRSVPFVIVGVLPAAFHGIDADRVPDVRLPISAAPLLMGSPVTEPGGDYPIRFQILVRLAPEISASEAASAMTPVLTGLEETLWRAWYARSSKPFPLSNLSHEVTYWRSYHVSLSPAGRGVSRLREQFAKTVVLLMGAVALLLCVVCGNIAGLLLAKAESRVAEIGIRLSLGASRWRIVRQLYAENLPLAVLGGAGAVVFVSIVSPLLLRFLPTLGVGAYSPPVVLDVQLNIRVFLFLLVMSLATVALFGLAPVLRACRFDLNRQMLTNNRSVSSASAHLAVTFQVALTMLLLIGSVLVCKTFWTLRHLNPGFDQDHVVEPINGC